MPPELPRVLNVFVPGRPAPQGSKHYFGPGRVVEMSRHLRAWRDDVRSTLMRKWEGQPPIEGGVDLVLEFVLHRPTGTPKRRTPLATKRPDFDKLTRGVCDAITGAGVFKDDSQVVRAVILKRLAEIDEPTGCMIRVQEIPHYVRKGKNGS
jgi:crossover junction endodeoxyribonuclease RusA